MAPPPDDPAGSTSRDSFLDGRVSVEQPTKGYRAGIDAVLLAAAVPARPGERVLELGCGVGVASLCLAARVPGVHLTGLEIQPDLAALAARNAAAAGIAVEVMTGDVGAPPPDLRRSSFDHVMANPPYHPRARGSPAPGAARETARGEGLPLQEWIDAGIRRLRPGGALTVVHLAERLPDLLAAMSGRLGAVRALPLAPRQGRAARLVLLTGVKGRRTPFRLLAPLVLHAGGRHEADGDGYTAAARAILRDGAAIADVMDEPSATSAGAPGAHSLFRDTTRLS